MNKYLEEEFQLLSDSDMEIVMTLIEELRKYDRGAHGKPKKITNLTKHQEAIDKTCYCYSKEGKHMFLSDPYLNVLFLYSI